AGSACGKSLGAVPVSTVGYEKIRNWAFQYENDEEGFVDFLLEGQPEPPRYFAMMKHLNKVKRPLLVEVPKHPLLTKEQFLTAYHNGMKVIDARDKSEFAQGFIPGSINIQGKNSFSTWAGWILNYEEQFMLVADDDQMEDLTRKLMRIGMDNIYGYVNKVEDLGVDLETVDEIGFEGFQNNVGNDEVQIIDVRGGNEFKISRVPGAKHVFFGTLPANLDEIPNDKSVIRHCQSGDRATIAYSILRRNGFDNIKNYPGGMQEWQEKAVPVLN